MNYRTAGNRDRPEECQSLNEGDYASHTLTDRSAKLCWHSISSSILGFIPTATVPSTAIVALNSNGEIVLIQRKDANFWSLPGGETAWGETIKKNTRRNLTTELGLEQIQLRHTTGLDYSADNSQLHSFSIVVIADVAGEIKIKDDSEIIDARFFSLDNLPSIELASLNPQPQL